MTLEQLKMLTLVAEHGSLKQASGVLFKTQPAISQGIKQLESTLGLTLFDRKHYRLTLTPQGEQINRHALKLLTEASKIKQLAQHLATGHEASITLALEASYDLQRIIPLLEKTQAEYPNTEIILKQEYLSGAFEAVQNQKADLAISPGDSLFAETGDFETCNLYRGHLVNVAAPRLIERHANLHSVEELRDEYQIIVQDSGLSSRGKNYSVEKGQRCWFVNDFSTKKTLILSGMGWGRLPENNIHNELESGLLQSLNLKDVKTKLGLDYYALKLKSRILGPVANQLWKNLQQTIIKSDAQ